MQVMLLLHTLLNNIAKQDLSKLQRMQICHAHVVLRAPRFSSRVAVKYRYLYLSTILSVLDVLEYLIVENAKYLYLYLIQSTW